MASGSRQVHKARFLQLVTRNLHPGLPFAFFLLPFYFLLALLFTNPLVLAIGTAVNDPVDPVLNTWILAWDHHALLTRPAQLFDANIFHPYAHTLLYSETLLLPALILLPLSAATGNPILTYNLLVLMGFTTTGVSGYLLGAWLLRNRWAGLVLGIALAFNSYTLSVLPKAQLLQFTWLPLALLYTCKLLQRPQPRSALLLAFFLAAQFYTVVYYGLFGFLAVGLVGGAGWLLQRFDSRAQRLRVLAMMLASGGIALLLCLPLAIPYIQLSQRQGLVRTLADAWPFAASLEMWRTPPPHSFFYGWLHSGDMPRVGFYPVEALFPGLALLLLAAAGLLLWLRQSMDDRPQTADGSCPTTHHASRIPLLLLLGIAFFFVLSLGPYLQVTTLQPDFSQILPYAWLHQWLPGFTALRAPARFAIFVFLGLGIAAGYVVARMRWRWLQAAFVLLLLAETLSFPASGLYAPSISSDRRDFYAWLATQPQTGYLELPVYSPTFDRQVERWLESQYESIFHWQPMPTGYSGFLPPRHTDLLLFVSLFPQPQATHFLQTLGVEWVMLQRDRLPVEQWQAIEMAAHVEGWEMQQWGDVWAVKLPPAAIVLPERSFFIPEAAQAGAALAITALFTTDQPAPILPGSELGHLQVEWWRAGVQVLAERIDHQPPFYVDAVAVAPVPVPVPEDAGLYEVRLVDPEGGQRLASATVAVVDDIAAPETTLLAVKPVGAEIICAAGRPGLHLHLQTIGWYDTAFTLSARFLNAQGTEVARSTADVAFPPYRPRINLLTTSTYVLPLQEGLPLPAGTLLTAEITAYQWQQAAERTVPRWFVGADGTVSPAVRLAVSGDTAGC